ncbi:uncharacterized protein LOC131350221 isoform X2 [Hemibagrus wyckioides]|uniref:uncharacterized protein LOC131350221 isoform X2 n=1 Tax=Hemibagrus wyckioides TaxID=337641 RepID=UPI00266D0B48|nr:uncharacterized protein LOC131350221 isoform X2 [Hemibagrus wyckioides]
MLTYLKTSTLFSSSLLVSLESAILSASFSILIVYVKRLAEQKLFRTEAAGEDSFELHSVDVELEAVEKQIRDLQVKLPQLRQRRDAHLSQVPAILTKNIGAVVLHAGTNDIRLRQTEILKKDFKNLVEKVRTTSPPTRIIVSGPLPTFQRGIESFSSTVTMAFTQAELEQQSSWTTSPGHCAPSDW